jgi:hypothetical protein
MPDPITVGSLVATALAAGATEAGKAALGAAAKDAYEKLRSAASRLFGSTVEQLVEKPESKNRIGTVAELVDEQPDAARAELRDLADALRNALEAEGRGALLNQFRAGRDQYVAQGGGIINIDQRGRDG